MPRKNKTDLTKEESSRVNVKKASAKRLEFIHERYRLIIGMIKDGHTAPDISAALGVTRRTVERARVWAGINRECKRHTESDYELGLMFLQDGCNYTEAARSCGVSATQLIRRYPGYAWTPSETGRHAVIVKMFNRIDTKPKGAFLRRSGERSDDDEHR